MEILGGRHLVEIPGDPTHNIIREQSKDNREYREGCTGLHPSKVFYLMLELSEKINKDNPSDMLAHRKVVYLYKYNHHHM